MWKGEMILLRVFRVKSFNFHSFVLLSCSFSHVTHLKVIKPSQAIQKLILRLQVHVWVFFKTFWSYESLIREICHAKKSSCEWNVTNLVFLRVWKSVYKMRAFGALCLHLVAGYQVSLRNCFGDNFWKLVTKTILSQLSFTNIGDAVMNLDRMESNWGQGQWRMVKLPKSWWG